jgi:hypothetical protein
VDSPRFDAFARSFAASTSRRGALRRLAAGGFGAALASALGRRSVDAQAGDCTRRGCRCIGGVRGACAGPLVCCPDNPGLPGGPGRCVTEDHCNPPNQPCTTHGCACNSGVRDACDDGLVCCADDPSLPGGPGRCEDESVCREHDCEATTNPCPSVCAAGSYCDGCCSGYCGDDDHCGSPSCTGIGCECNGGVRGACDPGLVCCQSQMGGGPVPGGPGMCAAADACGDGAGAGVGAELEATPAP